jgi:hypothetical protein
LVAALCDDKLVNTLIGENSGNPQLLGDDDLLGHGRSGDDLRRAGGDKK